MSKPDPKPSELLASYNEQRAQIAASLNDLTKQRAAAIRPDADTKLKARLPEILAQIAVLAEHDKGLDAAIEELQPALDAEAQARREAEAESERRAIAQEKRECVADAREIDDIGDKLIAKFAELAAKGAPLRGRLIDLHGRLYANDHARRGYSLLTLAPVEGRSGMQSAAIAAFVARLIEATRNPEGIDNAVAVHHGIAREGVTFAAAFTDEADRIARHLRVDTDSTKAAPHAVGRTAKYRATKDTWLSHENRLAKAGEEFVTTFPDGTVLGGNLELVGGEASK